MTTTEDTTVALKDPAPEDPTVKQQQDDDIHSSPTGNEDEDHDPYEEAEWDEGGESHCGYSNSVHATLMAMGKSVHNVVGKPGETVGKEMKLIGNWFQEASYTIRDFVRGKPDSGIKEDTMHTVETMKKDTIDAVSSMMGYGNNKEEEEDHAKDDDVSDCTPK